MDSVWLISGSLFFLGSLGLVAFLDRLRGED